jgi:predicted ATPase
LCGSAHVEQVVVTRAAGDLASAGPLAGAAFRPLGHHRLKDVPSAAQLFQLVAPGLRDDFPPLKTLSATSLPALHHRLVGRADALARVEALLETGMRLVTITGPGGAGKSRLALEVAARAALDRPVHLVGLAPVLDAELVPSAIARAIGTRESSGRSAIESVADDLNGSGALLFLDNLEHLPLAAGHVAELLDRASDLQVLATSRTPLRLSTEHVLPLGPLDVGDATTLFVELAAARGVNLRDDALASVHEICRRLDGLPLAIELVAARLAVLPPAEILRALGEGLALEMEGPVDLPERQRTLRAAIDWSYQRLTTAQRELHGALAVFSDSGALDDVRAVAAAGGSFLADLEALVGWSLVRSESTDGDLRLSMLETVREHALGQLSADGALDELRTRHAMRFVELALEAESELAGPDQSAWFGRLESELDNIGGALDWLLTVGRVEDALKVVSALERFWRGHAHVAEARRWLSLALAGADDVEPSVRAAGLRTASLQAAAQSDWTAAESMLSEARVLYHAEGEHREEVIALSYLSFFATRRNDIERAEQFAQEAVEIAAELDDDRAASGALSALAEVYSAQGEHELAVAQYEEAARLRTRLNDPLLLTDAVYSLGKAAFHASDSPRARRELGRALEQARGLDEAPYVAAAQLLLALIDLEDGEELNATTRAREALDLYSHLEDDRSRARCVLILAAASADRKEFEHAARLTGAAETLRGTDAPDEFELPLLERSLPELAARLGSDDLETLIAEGRSTGLTAIDPVVVSAESEA